MDLPSVGPQLHPQQCPGPMGWELLGQEVTPPPSPFTFTPVGLGLLLAATGGHYMIYTVPSPHGTCNLFLRGRDGREHGIWEAAGWPHSARWGTSVHRHPSATCLCSSPELLQGTGGGFSPKPEVNYSLLDNFQLPVLAVKEISSRWHAYLCAGREGSPGSLLGSQKHGRSAQPARVPAAGSRQCAPTPPAPILLPELSIEVWKIVIKIIFNKGISK